MTSLLGDDDSPRPPTHTPIPLSSDHRIDELADELAECRPDLTAEQRHMLARQIAYRCRSFRRGHATLAKQ
ncbi:hypothetical protein LCGC14_0258300 [marine sediment metagenome]|uniref:Uncharacterized protein n=1 Tax=marine sediment metagenome TaxID=412755 RepID=A0A0F9U2B8_9ZZZZ